MTNALKNQGKAAAQQEIAVTLYLSKDMRINPLMDIPVGGHGVAGLKASQQVTRVTKVDIPSDIVPGFYYLGAMVDSEDVVMELNENNNTRATVGTIEIK